jgi:dihydrofolate reductase
MDAAAPRQRHPAAAVAVPAADVGVHVAGAARRAWRRIRFARGDVRPVHREMAAAAKGKNVWIVGGGELAGQFYDAGLLDALFVQVGSVTLGSGKPLLPRAIISPPLKLLSVRQVGAGFAELHCEVPR